MPNHYAELSNLPLSDIVYWANNAYNAEKKKAAQVILRQRPTAARRCWKCSQWRSISEFPILGNGERGEWCKHHPS
ncbi:MAG: hypothetical protein JNJ83_10855 [Verrucomicrobiaceae bacterium]|nr:hypothetical protein [Verrucomicrobiaceae bacterium]